MKTVSSLWVTLLFSLKMLNTELLYLFSDIGFTRPMLADPINKLKRKYYDIKLTVGNSTDEFRRKHKDLTNSYRLL